MIIGVSLSLSRIMVDRIALRRDRPRTATSSTGMLCSYTTSIFQRHDK